MFTWAYYEFVNTVTFPGYGPCSRADLSKHHIKAVEDGAWLVFHLSDGQAVRTPVANVRYAGGMVTPQVVPADDAPVAPKKPKK